MRSAFPLNRQRERMHQLTPTYKQAVHFEMTAILRPRLPPPFLFALLTSWPGPREHARPASGRFDGATGVKPVIPPLCGRAAEWMLAPLRFLPPSDSAEQTPATRASCQHRAPFFWAHNNLWRVAIDRTQTRDSIKVYGFVSLLRSYFSY